MWSRLTLRSKLRIYFASLTSFVLIISILSIVFVNDINSKTEDFYDHPYQVTYSTKAIQSEIRNLFTTMLRLTNSTDAEDIITFSNSNTISGEIIEGHFLVIKSQYLGNQKDVTDLYELYKISEQNRLDVIEYMKAGEFQDAIDFVNNMGPGNVENLLTALEKIEVFAFAKAKSLNNEAEQTANLYTTSITIVVFVIFVMAGTLYFYLIKGMYPPLNKIIDTIESFNKGENENYLDLERHDELGIISNSFNKMLEFMKTKEETQSLKMELSELKNAEELNKIQLNLKASLNSPSDIIILSLDTEYRYMFYNQAHSNSMKISYNSNVVEGKCIFDFMSSQSDIDKVKVYYDRTLLGETHTHIAQFGDITKHYFETVYSPIIDDAQEIVGLTAFSRDVTKRENALIALKYEKETAQNYLDVAGVMIVILDIDGNIILMNKKGCKIIGSEYKDIIGKNWFDNYIPKKSKVEIHNMFLKVFSKKAVLTEKHDNVIITSSGEERLISWNNSLIVDEKQQITGVLSSGEDITDQRNKEIELQRTKMYLQSSLESPKDMIILSIDNKYNYNYFNQNHQESMLTIYGSEAKIGSNILEKVTIEEDKIMAKNNYDRALSGETYSVIQEYGSELKIYFESYFYPIFDENNDVVGASVFARNISDRVKEQQALRQSEERFKLLVNMMPLSIVQYQIIKGNKNGTLDFVILGVNKVFEKLMGMTSVELVGKSIRDLYENVEYHNIAELEKVALDNESRIFEDYSEMLDRYLRVIAYKTDSDKLAVIIEDTTETRERLKEIEYISYHDALTNLHNRRYYEDNLAILDVPENYPITIVMSDINGLKLINDAFGHTAGDKLLVSASKVILDACRKTDLVARIGGDEFVIVMPKTDRLTAEKIVDNINKEAKNVQIESIELSISFGFKTKNNDNEDIQEIYRSAEDSMYRVKLIEIPSMRSSAIETILNTLYEKDKSSEIHSRTVSDISEKLAIAAGMDRQDVNVVKTAGLLHDIGKIIIPISIITKQGKLTAEEYDLIKGHPEIGFRILNSTHDLRIISNIVLNHHERWDGLGYPRGITADNIPIQSRIISIADAFDAMTSERTYRDIFTYEHALNEIKNNSGTQFDPELVKVFVDNFDMITKI